MKHFKYRVVADKNWHIGDEEWMKKGVYTRAFFFNDFKEAEAAARIISNCSGVDMLIQYYQPNKGNWSWQVTPFMKGRLIK